MLDHRVRFGYHARMQREALQRAGVVGQRLQRDDFASGLRAGGDALGDRTHPQRVHAVIAASAVGQEDGLLLAFEPAFARQMPAHAIRDLVSRVRQLRGGRDTVVRVPSHELRSRLRIWRHPKGRRTDAW